MDKNLYHSISARQIYANIAESLLSSYQQDQARNPGESGPDLDRYVQQQQIVMLQYNIISNMPTRLRAMSVDPTWLPT